VCGVWLSSDSLYREAEGVTGMGTSFLDAPVHLSRLKNGGQEGVRHDGGRRVRRATRKEDTSPTRRSPSPGLYRVLVRPSGTFLLTPLPPSLPPSLPLPLLLSMSVSLSVSVLGARISLCRRAYSVAHAPHCADPGNATWCTQGVGMLPRPRGLLPFPSEGEEGGGSPIECCQRRQCCCPPGQCLGVWGRLKGVPEGGRRGGSGGRGAREGREEGERRDREARGGTEGGRVGRDEEVRRGYTQGKQKKEKNVQKEMHTQGTRRVQGGCKEGTPGSGVSHLETRVEGIREVGQLNVNLRFLLLRPPRLSTAEAASGWDHPRRLLLLRLLLRLISRTVAPTADRAAAEAARTPGPTESGVDSFGGAELEVGPQKRRMVG